MDPDRYTLLFMGIVGTLLLTVVFATKDVVGYRGDHVVMGFMAAVGGILLLGALTVALVKNLPTIDEAG